MTDKERISALEEALDYAIQVIEAYQGEIRNPPPFISEDLLSNGFCQGRIFLDAVPRIRRMLNTEGEDENE